MTELAVLSAICKQLWRKQSENCPFAHGTSAMFPDTCPRIFAPTTYFKLGGRGVDTTLNDIITHLARILAEVILTEGSNDDIATKKRGKFLPSEDLIIVHEVAAQRAHVAAYGTVKQTFENVAVKINQNPHMTQKVVWKFVQDRHKRLQEDFDRDDVRNSALSGVAGGEMGELYQTLSQMREERQSFADKKKAAKNEKEKKEEEKEMLGKKVVEMALLRKAQRSSEERSDEGEEGEDGSSEGSGGSSSRKRRKKRAKVERIDLTSSLPLFADKLKDADMARVKLDGDVLEFKKHKHEIEIVEREKDRAERRQEREDANKLELENFKLMMDVFKMQKP